MQNDRDDEQLYAEQQRRDPDSNVHVTERSGGCDFAFEDVEDELDDVSDRLLKRSGTHGLDSFETNDYFERD